jgi:hypothetical protein
MRNRGVGGGRGLDMLLRRARRGACARVAHHADVAIYRYLEEMCRGFGVAVLLRWWVLLRVRY